MANYIGSDGDDKLTGTNGDDTFHPGGGHNVVTARAGSDVIYSRDGIDTIDGGTGDDLWDDTYSTTTPLSFDDATGTLSNGTSIKGIEEVRLHRGSGESSYTISNTSTYSQVLLFGGQNNSLKADFSSSMHGISVAIDSLNSNFDVSAANSTYLFYAEDLAAFTLKGTVYPDDFEADMFGLQVGGNIALDGGDNIDSLSINLRDSDSDNVLVDQGGGKTVSNLGSFVNFETYYLTGGNGADQFTGGAGNDKLAGGAGNDVLDGGAGNDELNGGDGIDTVSYGSASSGVTVSLNISSQQDTGGAGSDTVFQFENLTGSAYDDVLTGTQGDNVLIGGGGNDELIGRAGADTLIGGAGNDVYKVSESGDVVVEAADGGNDIVKTTLASYTLPANVERLAFTGTGDFAGTGNDGDNAIAGGAGDDVLLGLGGNDRLAGGTGANHLDGGYGNDVLIGGGINDVLDGGAERHPGDVDTVDFSATPYAVTVDLTKTGMQTTHAGKLEQILNIQNLIGGDRSDTFTGGDEANVFRGNAGDDTLSGGGGDDVLIGGAGRDYLTGGTGADRFVYLMPGDSAVGGARDQILDFTHGQDKIDLSALRSYAGGTLTFAGDTAGIGTGRVSEHMLGSTDVIVELDFDGDGVRDFQIDVKSNHLLVASDFIL